MLRVFLAPAKCKYHQKGADQARMWGEVGGGPSVMTWCCVAPQSTSPARHSTVSACGAPSLGLPQPGECGGRSLKLCGRKGLPGP